MSTSAYLASTAITPVPDIGKPFERAPHALGTVVVDPVQNDFQQRLGESRAPENTNSAR